MKPPLTRFPSLAETCFRTVGERLKYLRERLDLTLGDAVELTGISKTELWRIEDNQRRLTYDHLKAFSTAYQIELNCLDEIVHHRFSSEISRLATTGRNSVLQHESASIPCFGYQKLERVGKEGAVSNQISLSVPLILSPLAYAIKLDDVYQTNLGPLGTLFLVDPALKPVLEDQVVNTISWNPLIVQITRNEKQHLVGALGLSEIDFGKEQDLKEFHKIVYIFPFTPNILVDEEPDTVFSR